jgi:NTP pyrophosphatase (non-canonical NTP hydrolase)
MWNVMNRNKKMPRASRITDPGQILLFPTLLPEDSAEAPVETLPKQNGISVVLCGTYRKDPEGLRRAFERLKDSGFQILSPGNPFIESEKEGFVYMRHESTSTPDELENRHLDAIQRSDFVWFFAPNGYVGPTGALEVGFARANGIPVFSDTPLDDTVLKGFVQTVPSPEIVQDNFANQRILPPPPAVKTFQNYYRRAAIQRGYTNEGPKECLLLMLEEFGELARALRKKLNLMRHGKEISNEEALELADIFIYVVHMANILKIDLSSVVQEKELLNIQKMINGKRKATVI